MVSLHFSPPFYCSGVSARICGVMLGRASSTYFEYAFAGPSSQALHLQAPTPLRYERR